MQFQHNTLDYYNHNAVAYFRRTYSRFDIDPLQEFTKKIPSQGRILDAGCGGGRDLKYFSNLGYRAEGFDGSSELVKLAQKELDPSGIPVWRADIMMLSLPKEAYDGIWARQVLIHFPPEGCQRIMASFFLALKSNAILFVSFEEGQETIEDRTDDPSGPARQIYQYPVNKVASLIRQHGFQILSLGRGIKKPSHVGFIARRL